MKRLLVLLLSVLLLAAAGLAVADQPGQTPDWVGNSAVDLSRSGTEPFVPGQLVYCLNSKASLWVAKDMKERIDRVGMGYGFTIVEYQSDWCLVEMPGSGIQGYMQTGFIGGLYKLNLNERVTGTLLANIGPEVPGGIAFEREDEEVIVLYQSWENGNLFVLTTDRVGGYIPLDGNYTVTDDRGAASIP